jgi:hypothetical protein
MSCPDAAAVFVVDPINHVMATVFDAVVIGRGIVDKIGFLPVLEEQGNILVLMALKPLQKHDAGNDVTQ